MRTVFRAERMQISRCGSLRETLLDEEDRLSNGDWKIVRADSRSPVAWEIVPAAYSIRYLMGLGRLGSIS